MNNLEQLVSEAVSAFAATNDPNELEQIKARYLGKSGYITEGMKSLGKLANDERKSQGEKLNLAKQAIELALKNRRNHLKEIELAAKLQSEAIDISLPGKSRHRGSVHPVMQTQQRVEELFASIGFTVADGPEIETDYFNFTALNTPEKHPARSMHDTFYLLDENEQVLQDVLLRTHTSPIQARYMQAHVAQQQNEDELTEIRIIAPGRVYRVDSDATHSPMFHQLEGLWVSQQVSFADLKGVIVDFLHKFFASDDLKVRFRPSFFPFTEPSAEIDIAFMSGDKKGKWLEVLGCGMVHPNVLRLSGINPDKYTGFAFGLGLDRLTMLRYGIDDLRLLFDGDLRFLRQFAH